MNSTQLETFLAVAETLSFARAAEQMHVTQPTVSHQIKSLEAELGCSLFHRTTRRVRPTEEGKQFLPEAEIILSAMRRAQSHLRSKSSNEPTRISVGCRSFIYAAGLGDIFRTMAQEYGNLYPDVIVIPHDRLHQHLEEGELDVVLDFQGSGHAGECYHELARTDMVCACLADSPLVNKTAIVEHDLDTERLALPHLRNQSEDLRAIIRNLVGNNPERHFIVASIESAMVLTQAGLAVTVQPKLAIPIMPNIRYVPIAGAPQISFGAFTWGNPDAGNGVVKSFLKLAAGYFAPLG